LTKLVRHILLFPFVTVTSAAKKMTISKMTGSSSIENKKNRPKLKQVTSPEKPIYTKPYKAEPATI